MLIESFPIDGHTSVYVFLTLWGLRSTFVTQIKMQTNIGNFMTLLKPHNIGTHLKGIETSFQVVPLFLKSFHFWVSYHFLKFSQNTFSL
jgi:hypothetical protein